MPSDEKRYKDTAVSISEIEFFADDIDPVEASRVYQAYGCLVVRGLMKDYVEQIQVDIETIAQESIAQLDQAQKIVEGWRTPNGTLFLPAPEDYHRDRQIMVLAIHYHNSDVFRQTSQDPRALEIVQAILGDDYEVFGNGQSLYKEPAGGHSKLLHQDSAYFQHRRYPQLCSRHQSDQWGFICGAQIPSIGTTESHRHLFSPWLGTRRVGLGGCLAYRRSGGRFYLLPRPSHSRLQTELF